MNMIAVIFFLCRNKVTVRKFSFSFKLHKINNTEHCKIFKLIIFRVH